MRTKDFNNCRMDKRKFNKYMKEKKLSFEKLSSSKPYQTKIDQ